MQRSFEKILIGIIKSKYPVTYHEALGLIRTRGFLGLLLGRGI